MERPLYLESLNAKCFRYGEENPRVIRLVNFTPKGYEERPCFKVMYDSDGYIDYVPYSEIADNVWRLI
ncbi:hypothetical protein [Bacillus cereus]|uniref:Uncharacterized protein n=1 Tax=Bacillus cereus HuA3-9 TaxID=1053205 RepID=R8CIG9_BACCE|nr:hypothetical protein [Bacillus cereus]EOO11358.1 hypothetical protein IGA_05621 [Bacillus cereus HuA3-9]